MTKKIKRSGCIKINIFLKQKFVYFLVNFVFNKSWSTLIKNGNFINFSCQSEAFRMKIINNDLFIMCI